MKKLIILSIVFVIVAGSVAFYGGMKYAQSKNPLNGFSRQNFQDLSPEQREQFSQGRTGISGGSFLNGEVIAKNEQSLTLKLSDGGSKIVFFSSSTQISKMAEGSISDIEIGKQIAISGDQNSDGSYTAKIIQLSPLGR